MVRVGYARFGFALDMYISCCSCPFHLRWVPNGNPVSNGIQALLLENVYCPIKITYLSLIFTYPYPCLFFTFKKNTLFTLKQDQNAKFWSSPCSSVILLHHLSAPLPKRVSNLYLSLSYIYLFSLFLQLKVTCLDYPPQNRLVVKITHITQCFTRPFLAHFVSPYNCTRCLTSYTVKRCFTVAIAHNLL